MSVSYRSDIKVKEAKKEQKHSIPVNLASVWYFVLSLWTSENRLEQFVCYYCSKIPLYDEYPKCTRTGKATKILVGCFMFKNRRGNFLLEANVIHSWNHNVLGTKKTDCPFFCFVCFGFFSDGSVFYRPE